MILENISLRRTNSLRKGYGKQTIAAPKIIYHILISVSFCFLMGIMMMEILSESGHQLHILVAVASAV